MKALSKFLASSISGYLFVVLLVGVLGVGGFAWNWVDNYRQLQTDAAYCKGSLDAQAVVRSIQNRASDAIDAEAKDAIDEIEALKDNDDETNPEAGCAGERLPDSILRYHGRLRE